MTYSRLAFALALALPVLSANAEPSIYPTGVTRYDPAKAYNSYIAFGAPDGKSHLIDMDGNEVHSWNKLGFPTLILDPALAGGERGHILLQTATIDDRSQEFNGIFNNKSIGEQDWNGKLVWEWKGEQAPGGAVRQNHDWGRLPNGDTLVVATIDHVLPEFSQKPIADQAIYEVTPAGKIVWRWVAGDHIHEFGINQEGFAQLKALLKNGYGGFGFLTINDMKPIGPNKWFDAGDARFNPDNIVIDSREVSFIAIIDKKTGKLVWRLGPDYAEAAAARAGVFFNAEEVALRPNLSHRLPRPVDQTSGQHDAHIIPKGLPGAGDLLLFDNEGPSGFPPTHLGTQNGSRVLEIDPVKRSIVWEYSAVASGSPGWSFFSSFISSARRLPNGNTLIDEGMNGRIFQVTPQGEIVWEYVNPHFGDTTLSGGAKVSSNWVYRAQPVAYDWVPDGTPHAEKPVAAPVLSDFHVAP